MKFLVLFPLILLPLSTFINLQSITVPIVHRIELLKLNGHPSLEQRSTLVMVFSIASLSFGFIGNAALFVRMLEKKIKWMTRLIMIGALGQGILALLALILFHALEKTQNYLYTESAIYKMIAATSSLISLAMIFYNYLENIRKHQVCVWVSRGLSYEQRQFILLLISSLSYISLSAGLYTYLEDWQFDQSLYWIFSALLTIGFGDVTPITTAGMALFPLISFFGIALVGSNIYAMRNLFLEVLAMKLASQYSKFMSIPDDDDDNRPDEMHSPHDLYIPYRDALARKTPITIPIVPSRTADLEFELKKAHSSHNYTDKKGHQLGVSLDSSEALRQIKKQKEASSTKIATPQPPTQPEYLDLPFSRTYTEPIRKVVRRKTMTISRSTRFPSVTIIANVLCFYNTRKI